jgi:hypothetical protein
MGWWTIDRSGRELVLGDTPFDIIGEAFQQVAQEYQEGWNRKPTLAEVIETIETVLAIGVDSYLSDGDGIEIISLNAKTKRRRKNQQFQVGDFFTIPLEGGRFSFGRILSDERYGEMGMLVGIYDKVSKKVLPPRQLKREQFMFPAFYCTDEGWKTWRWKIIGNIPVEHDEFSYPKFKEGLEGLGWWIRDRDKVYEATEEQVQDLEYASLYSPSAVEKRIEKFLKTQSVG